MIDRERLADLRAEVGVDGFAEVIALFLEESDMVLAQLGQPGRDLGRDLHFLKGSALNLGFSHLARLCQAAERLLDRGLPDQLDLPGLRQAYRLSRAELQNIEVA